MNIEGIKMETQFSTIAKWGNKSQYYKKIWRREDIKEFKN
mgnify:CR=1 FL=1